MFKHNLKFWFCCLKFKISDSVSKIIYIVENVGKYFEMIEINVEKQR